MSEQTFTAKEVVKLITLLYPERVRFNLSHLNYYKRNGIVEPTSEELGKHSIKYSLEDLVLVSICVSLRRASINAAPFASQFNKLRKSIRRLRRTGWPERTSLVCLPVSITLDLEHYLDEIYKLLEINGHAVEPDYRAELYGHLCTEGTELPSISEVCKREGCGIQDQAKQTKAARPTRAS